MHTRQVRPAISHRHPSRLAGEYNPTLVYEALEALQRGTEEDILAPLRRWQSGLVVARVCARARVCGAVCVCVCV
jgi:hypothetical protein